MTHALPAILHILRQLLLGGAFNVTPHLVPLAFEFVESAQPSLIVVDLVLGEQFGWNLLGRLRLAAS